MSLSTDASARLPRRRAAASAAIASSRLASAPAQAAVDRRLVVARLRRLETPRSASSPSMVGGARPGLDRGRAGGHGERFERRQIDPRRRVAPSRCADSVAKQVPRASALASRVARLPSDPVEGRGNAQAHVQPLGVDGLELERPAPRAAAPAARANPVMLLYGHCLNAFRGSDRANLTAAENLADQCVRLVHIEFRRRPLWIAVTPSGSLTTGNFSMIKTLAAAAVLSLGLAGYAMAEDTPAARSRSDGRADALTIIIITTTIIILSPLTTSRRPDGCARSAPAAIMQT